MVSVPHPYPLHFYHFSAVQPNLQLPAPASRFPRAFSGGSVHMHGEPEIAENSSPQSRLQYYMTPAPSSLEWGDSEVCFTWTPRVPQQDSAPTAHIGNLLHNTPSIWLLRCSILHVNLTSPQYPGIWSNTNLDVTAKVFFR